METTTTTQGHTKYQGVLSGTFQIVDKNNLTLAGGNQLRVCMEFGTSKKATEFREQVRFSKELSGQWAEPQISKTFDARDALTPYRFCALPSDDPSLQSDKTGYKITGGQFVQSSASGDLKWERPFATGVTGSLTLKGGESYKTWIQWGIWDDKAGATSRRVYGARTVADGIDMPIQKPPTFSLLSAVSLSTPIALMALLLAATLN